MENQEEIDNTEYIAEQIFSNPPLEKNSISLQLEEQTLDIGLKESGDIDRFIFKIVATITYHGIKILYGHKDITRLNDDDFILIKRYVNSYGYEIMKDIIDDKLVIGIKYLR